MDQSNVYPTMSDDYFENWNKLLGETTGMENSYQQDGSQSDSLTDQTTSFGFQQQEEDPYLYQPNFSSEDINPEIDYETLIRTKDLYFDPDPKIIRKSISTNPVVYNQNIMVRFLQPPPVPQGPLIIQEVRPPQPPPPPPLVIRQHAPPPLSPPPIILRERPPPIPAIITAQVITKHLPPIPPPPRSVIIEKLPPLPAKPRDIIIERWIPYESTQKRKVIVHRAEEAKPYPPPKNVIITYEPVQTRIIRQFERLGVTPEDPRKYSAVYGNSLLATEQLLTQMQKLGITEDLSPPHIIADNQQTSTNLDYNFHLASQDAQNYAPTYENLVQARLSSTDYDEPNDQQIGQISSLNVDDLSSQLAQYGLTTESIPY